MNVIKGLAVIFFINLVVNLPAQGDEFVPCQVMPCIINDYYAGKDALDNVYVAAYSPEVSQRYLRLAREYRTYLDTIRFEKLSQGCKADYVLFGRNLKRDEEKFLRQLADFDRLKKYFPYADTIYALEKGRRRAALVDGARVAADFSAMVKRIERLRHSLSGSKDIDLTTAVLAGRIIGGQLAALKSFHQFYQGYDPVYTWWVEDLYDKLIKGLKDYSDSFDRAAKNTEVKKDSSGINGVPEGREELMRQLKFEMIPYTPEQLVLIANKELAWCDREMEKASKEMGFGTDWRAAQEKVKSTSVPVGYQAHEIMKLYNQSVDFVKSHNLITLPPLADETWRIVMMTPEQQKYYPFFYGGPEVAVSYPTNTMDYDERMMSIRGNNLHFSRAVVHHEILPGHYLQHFMNSKYKSYRRYQTPFWTEGWALYWELLLWDEGFPQSPEDRIGMLYWRKHRCARIIFSLNYHLGLWTPHQCIDFLVDRVGNERANAEAEVRRSFAGGYGPLYQLAYMIGGLQFMALKNEALSRGMTIREFNDAVLHENAMPVEMLRNLILQKPIGKNFETKWKFYQK